MRVVIIAAALVVAGCGSAAAPGATPGVRRLAVEVVTTIPHEAQSFTQGWEQTGTGFLETTGGYGSSELRAVDPDGTVRRRVALDPDVFGEGLTVVGDEVVVLTLRSGQALVFDAVTFEPTQVHTYDGEGWGLCAVDDEHVVMSDGGDTLSRRRAATFEVVDEVQVTIGGRPVTQINELECVGDTVWANLWKQEVIVGIDLATGTVHSVVDAGGLYTPPDDQSVLNGIAHDARADTFWLTGKNWPITYEVRFVEQ